MTLSLFDAIGEAPLTANEQAELARHEATIERGLHTFVEVGSALLAIRDGKLYRQHYQTFEDYCRERWSIARRTAYQLMDAASVVENVRHGAQIIPANERQARPLARLEPEQQAEAWQRAVETAPNGKVTAAHVQRVVEEMTAEPEPDEELADEEPEAVFEIFESEPAIEEPEPLPARTEPEPTVAPKMAVHYSSETPEWYTPGEIIDRVIATLGAIDLDPCSNSRENPNVPAANHYTREDDGLFHLWHGRVYLNPPYGRELADWIAYLLREWHAGRVTEAIALVPSRTDTEWFRSLRDFPRCFIWGRLRFSGHENSAPFPSMAVYLGDNPGAFIRAFSDIGDIYERVEA